jgi:hypothetical protein
VVDRDTPSTLSRPTVDRNILFIRLHAAFQSLILYVVPTHVLAAGNKTTLLTALTSILRIGEVGTTFIRDMCPRSMDTG